MTTNKPSSDPTSDGLAVAVLSQLKRNAEADVHVTLVSDTDAYDALLTRVPLIATSYGSGSPTLIVTLPKQTAIRYAYVDSYHVAGSSAVTCPSEPRGVALDSKSAPIDLPSPQAERVAATLTEALPALPCGKVFIQARVTRAAQAVGFMTNKTRIADVEVFVDSDGRLVNAVIYRSSGVDYADERALAAAEQSTYAPATFLCVPIVGRYLFRDFVP